MLGYGLFSRFYDLSVERLYVDARSAATAALELGPGLNVLDAPAGTGQSLDGLSAGVGPGGRVVGVDFSPGMLEKARARVASRGLSGVVTLVGDARTLGVADLEAVGVTRIDRLHVFLGLSVIPDWEAAFENLWSLLAPGGRCVVVDVHADSPGMQGRMVQIIAGADLRRRTWEPLKRLGRDYREIELPQRWEHGGRIFLATAVKG